MGPKFFRMVSRSEQMMKMLSKAERQTSGKVRFGLVRLGYALLG